MEIKRGDKIVYTRYKNTPASGTAGRTGSLSVEVIHADGTKVNIAHAFIDTVNGKNYWTPCNKG